MVMAQQYPEIDVYVLTRSRCREKIEQSLAEMGLPNIHYLFYDVPKWMYYKKEIGSKWGEQFNYIIWQLMCRKYIKKRHEQLHFDIIHHLTFNQYRTPSPGFFMDIPFVMGPVGGAETINPVFYQDLEQHTIHKEKVRLRGMDLRLFGWLVKQKKNNKVFLFSSRENMERLRIYCKGYQASVLPAIGFNPHEFEGCETVFENTEKTFVMVYAGKALDWKGIHVFLKSARIAFVEKGIQNFVIRLIGIRFPQELDKVNGWINELGLQKQVELIPFMQRDDLLKELSSCDLSVYPAFRDSGSMSVLEASALGCPTICFNAGGQDAFPDEVLLKVQIADDYNETIMRFAQKLLWAYSHRDKARKIGYDARCYVAHELTWEKKVGAFHSIYLNLLNDSFENN
ncbi:MAG: glycosyltransferase [Prevotella sp.]|nr:glycosyltransferase [Prevotella sp.]